MRSVLLAASLLLLACAPKEEAAPPADPPPPPPAPTVADFAGTWNSTTNMPGADPIQTKLVINADGTGSLIAEGRDPIPLSLSMSGDSIIAVSPEYESLVRKGAKVTIRTANVRTGETLTGVVFATYKTSKGEETANGTMTSTKAP